MVILIFHLVFVIQGDDLETPRGLPAGARAQPMGIIHHMERWETGTKALPQFETGQSEEGDSPSHISTDFYKIDLGKLE